MQGSNEVASLSDFAVDFYSASIDVVSSEDEHCDVHTLGSYQLGGSSGSTQGPPLLSPVRRQRRARWSVRLTPRSIKRRGRERKVAEREQKKEKKLQQVQEKLRKQRQAEESKKQRAEAKKQRAEAKKQARKRHAGQRAWERFVREKNTRLAAGSTDFGRCGRCGLALKLYYSTYYSKLRKLCPGSRRKRFACNVRQDLQDEELAHVSPWMSALLKRRMLQRNDRNRLSQVFPRG